MPIYTCVLPIDLGMLIMNQNILMAYYKAVAILLSIIFTYVKKKYNGKKI